LAGKAEAVSITPGSIAYRAYGRSSTIEQFLCNYGLSANYRTRIESAGLRITGFDSGGEARVLERSDHPFFIGTLFLPQFSSTPDAPHPLLVAFLRAASDFRRS
jgi:CTP synthase (UTP-ammonia lyase)